MREFRLVNSAMVLWFEYRLEAGVTHTATHTAMGKVMINSVPRSGVELTLIVPLCFSTTICCAMASPKPVPLPTALVVNK